MKRAVVLLFWLIGLSLSAQTTENVDSFIAANKAVMDSMMRVEKNYRDSIFESKLSRIHLIPSPIFYRSPETGVALGLGAFYRFKKIVGIDSIRPRYGSVYGQFVYTSHKQTIIEFGWTFFPSQAKWFVKGTADYEDFIDRWYGVGMYSPQSNLEKYWFKRVYSAGQFYRYIANGWYIGPQYVLYHMYDVEYINPNGQLATGNIVGSKGSNTVGLGLSVLRDKRDDVYVPKKGSYFDFNFYDADKAFGTNHPFWRLRLDARYYLPQGKKTVWAFQLTSDFTRGDVPFNMLPVLGGDKMLRGYFRGRYRDKDFSAIQAEWRRDLKSGFGCSAFASAGKVSESLKTFNFNNPAWAVGVGLRYLVPGKQRLLIRADFARNALGEFNYYLRVNEAF